MEHYNAKTAPNPEIWLALDEAERIDLVENYIYQHESDIEDEAKRLHASIHVVVENQLALGEEPTVTTFARLMRQGLDRHEAVHAVGAVISEQMFHILKGDKNLQPGKYKARLKRLTAKRWKKRQMVM